MDPKVLFKKSLEQATATFKCVGKQHFKNPTPCADWNCQALLAHMLYELSWVPDMLSGKTVEQVGDKYEGNLLTEDHIASWQKAADKAIKAVNQARLSDTVHLSYADVTASDYLSEIGNDLLIHSWDASQSYNCSLIFEDKLAQALYDVFLPRMSQLTESHLYGKPFKAAGGSRIQTKLLAIEGRHEPAL